MGGGEWAQYGVALLSLGLLSAFISMVSTVKQKTRPKRLVKYLIEHPTALVDLLEAIKAEEQRRQAELAEQQRQDELAEQQRQDELAEQQRQDEIAARRRAELPALLQKQRELKGRADTLNTHLNGIEEEFKFDEAVVARRGSAHGMSAEEKQGLKTRAGQIRVELQQVLRDLEDTGAAIEQLNEGENIVSIRRLPEITGDLPAVPPKL
jgi:hypothetical protein